MLQAAARTRTVALALAALGAGGAGTAVAVAAPSFAPSPASTKTAPTGTDANFTAVAVTPPEAGEAGGQVAVASFRTVSGTDTARALVLQGGSRGSEDVFASATELLTAPGRALGIAQGDVDADGRADLALTASDSSTRILLDRATGFVTAPTVTGTGTVPHLGDLNGDGRADLVTAGSQTIQVRLAAAAGTFGPPTGIGSGFSGTPVLAVGDLDGDGRADVLAAEGPTAQLLRGQAAGAPTAAAIPVTLAAAGTTVRALALADLDRTGPPDVVALLGDGRLSTVLHPSAAAYAAPAGRPEAVSPAGANAPSLAVADVDGDLLGDVVSSGYDGRVRLSTYQGRGLFTGGVELADAAQGSAVGAVELTRDARPDVVYVFRTFGSQELRVLRNTTPFPPQVQPGVTVSDVTATSAVVSGTVKTAVPGAQARAVYGVGRASGAESAVQEVGLVEPAFRTRHTLTGLTPGTTYLVRVSATNEAGTAGSDTVSFTTGGSPAPTPGPDDTTLTADLLAPSGGPTNRTIEASDSFLSVSLTGSSGPWSVSVDWGANEGDPAQVDGITDSYGFLHDFHAAPPLDPTVIRQSGPRRAYRTVTVTATDAFGRQRTRSQLVIVRPDTDPTASIGLERGLLEYGADNSFVSLSTDADAPEDEIKREQWDLDADGLSERDVASPPVSPCVQTAPPAVTRSCLGASPGRVTSSPWEEHLKRLGRGPLKDYKLSTQFLPFPIVDTQANLVRRNAAALRKAAAQLCEVCAGPVPPRKVSLAVTDLSDRTSVATRVLPVRQPRVPRADGVVSVAQAAGIDSALKADSAPGAGDGTPVTVDPSRSTVDGQGLKPVWYVLEVGTPFQVPRSSGGGCLGDKPPIKPAPDVGEITQDLVDPGFAEFPGAGFAGPAGPAANLLRAARPRATTTASFTPSASKPVKFDGCGSGPSPADYGVNAADVVIVTQDPAALRFTIPRAGVNYSALLTVFDRYGQSDKIRFDGFQAIANSAQCASRSYALASGVNLAGGCISYAGSPELAWTSGSLILNGLELVPQDGASWIIDSRGSAPAVYAASGSPDFGDPGAWKKDPATHRQAAADLLLSGAPAARFRPRDRCDKAPASVPSRTKEWAAADPFCVTAPDAQHRGPLPDAAYQGLELAGPVFMVTEPKSKGALKSVGRSVVSFQAVLPGGFGTLDADGEPVSEASAPTTLNGSLDVKGVTVTTNDSRSARARAARAGRPVARAAVAGTNPGRIAVAQGTALAGFPLSSPLTLDIDPATGSGTGSAKIGLLTGLEAEVTVTLTGGRLTGVSGVAPLPAPGFVITPGVFLTSLAFGIDTSTLELTGQVTVSSLGDLAKVVGTVVLRPSPFRLQITGNLKLAGISLAQAAVMLSQTQFSAGASFGVSFGPASLSGSVTGDVGAYGFNISGAARACIGVCRGVTALLSSKGAAACGDVDLLFTSFFFGFGVRYSPFDLDLYLTGCSVEPYRATATAGSRAALPKLDPQVALAGASSTFAVNDDLGTLSVVVRSAPGSFPKVTLVEPGGPTFTTPVQSDDFATATPDAFVEADPELGVTRFVVGKPRKGRWTLVQAPDSPAVTSADLGRDVPRPTKGSFKGTVVARTPESFAAQAVKAGSLQGVGLLGVAKASKAKRRAVVALAAKAPKRKQQPKLAPLVKVPTGAAIGSAELDRADLRRVVRMTVAATLHPGDRVTFSERAEGIAQQLGEYVVPADGRLRAQLSFEPARSPQRGRSIDAVITSADGVPRAQVDAITSYTADPIVAKDPPDITRVERRGKTRTLVFRSGPSYPSSAQPEWRLTAEGSYGTQLTRTISGADLKEGKRGTWRLKLSGIAPDEDFKTIRVTGLDAMARTSARGAERTRSLGGATKGALPLKPAKRGRR